MLAGFREIWAVDFEFTAPAGERPRPICMVARELRSGRLVELWEDDLRRLTVSPLPTGSDTLTVAYYSSAEVGCYLALGWPLPERVLDLYAEFRAQTNGMALVCGRGLLGALAHHGLPAIEAAEKADMRDLAMRGGPWTAEEKRALLDYCETDVDALARLLPAMEPRLDLPRALLRGRYMLAAARIEHTGIPMDMGSLETLRECWPRIKAGLVEKLDTSFGVFDGTTFKADRWANYLAQHGIPWPTLETGRLALDDDTFREMARMFPEVATIRELRHALSQLRLSDLSVGSDGRNRCLLSAFASRTGRNQPSNSAFIFGPSVWLRGLIQPAPGWGVAYCDWEQQEFGIAAALSGDRAMMAAYSTGDPYLAFAQQAGAVPAEATKKSHKQVRDQFKQCSLAVLYGAGPQFLAQRIGQSASRARELLDLHHRTYPVFWAWSDAALDHAMLRGHLHTVFGWEIHLGREVNPRSLRNFPMQANGAEMLRLACCLATERGILVCAPVHDALLIEAPLDDLPQAVAMTQAAMAEASRIVLGGFELRTEAKLVRYPERFLDDRGRAMWNTVWQLIEEVDG